MVVDERQACTGGRFRVKVRITVLHHRVQCLGDPAYAELRSSTTKGNAKLLPRSGRLRWGSGSWIQDGCRIAIYGYRVVIYGGNMVLYVVCRMPDRDGIHLA